MLNQKDYLNRIGYCDQVEPSVEHLKGLQRSQFHSIPFENFDICLCRAIDLEPASLQHKLIHCKRGGYCFELNGLFLLALQSFGFDARALLGRVHITGTPSGRGHQLSLVTIKGQQWIVDVGFGRDTPCEPLPLKVNETFHIQGQVLRLIESQNFGFMLQKMETDSWKDLYSFDLEYVCPADIAYGNHYTSTSPNSHFFTSRVAMLPIDDGMITLHNMTLKKTIGSQQTLTELKEGQPYIEALKTNFGIELDASYNDLKPFVGN